VVGSVDAPCGCHPVQSRATDLSVSEARIKFRTRFDLRAAFLVSCVAMAPLSAYAGEKITIEIVELTFTVNSESDGSVYGKAILPGGSHASFLCQMGERQCDVIQSFTPGTSRGSGGCATPTKNSTSVTCTTIDLGLFPAQRNGNELLIHGPNKAKRRYRIVGSW